MPKLELGFPGERFYYLPLDKIQILKSNPITKDLFIQNIGHFTRASHHFINRDHGCCEYLFIYCTDGKGHIVIDNKPYILYPNQFIILPPNIQHRYRADHNDPWSIYWIHFLGEKAESVSNRFYTPTDISYSDQSRIKERLLLFDEIFQTLYFSNSVEELEYANMCFNYFVATFRYLDIYRKNNVKQTYSDGIVNRLTHFMSENIDKKMSIKDFAQFAGYSESHLHRIFLSETGFSPIDYFIRLKVSKACFYILNFDLKFNQIANILGFKDLAYFSRIFSKVMGVSPSVFKNQKDIADIQVFNDKIRT